MRDLSWDWDKPAAASRPALVTVTAEELVAMALPPREMILAPFLPTKGLAMIYGPRGIGKTHLTIGIGLAVASGGQFLRWQAPRPRRVLVIDGEMPGSALQERTMQAVQRSDTEPPDANYLRFLAADMQPDRSLNLSDQDHQADLAPHLDGADLLIIDNIATLAAGGRENETEGWLPVQQWALQQRRVGRSVLFMHHAGKGGQQRGTSAREDVLDSVIALRRPGDYDPAQGARFALHFEKSRGFHGDDAKPFEATLGIGGWSTRDMDDADTARVAQLQAEEMSIRDIATETGMHRSKVERLLKKARATGYVTPIRPT